MIVKNVSTRSNSKGLGESICFSFIIKNLVLDKDIGIDLSLSLETGIVISVDSSLVVLDHVILVKLVEHVYLTHCSCKNTSNIQIEHGICKITTYY